MIPDHLGSLLDRLGDSQARLCDLLAPLADQQDWRPAPGEWSLRFLAAHLAAAEQECFQERIRRIAAADHPVFDYYLDTGRDFTGCDLLASLQTWRQVRQDILACVRELPEPAWKKTGLHARMGRISIVDVLRSMLDHDLEHLADLQKVLAGGGPAGAST